MMLDPELKKLVEAVLAETDTTKRSDLLDAMIYHWTGVENVAPNSRDSNSGYGHVMDARQLEALEALVGRGYLGTWCIGSRDPNPHGQASSELIAEYRKFKNYTEAQLLVQSDYTLIGDVMDSLFSGSGRESFIVNWEALNTKLTGLMAQGETAKVLEIITLLDHLGIYTSSYQQQKQQIIQSGSEFGNLLKELHGSPNLYQVTNASWGTTLDMKGTTAQGRIDIIRFDDSVLAQDIQVTRKDQSLILTYKKTGQTIELSNYFYYQGDTTGKATSEIQFIQGSEIETWYLEQIKVMALQDTGGDDVILGYEVDNKIDGGLGNDKIDGGNKNDLLMGGVGNDTIDGKNGDDTIMGGDGDDRLYGSWGNKLFIGGAGNDYLAGGNGFNTYQFSRGWGSDSITAGNYSKYGKDIISFTDDIKPSDIIARRSNDSIILKLKGTDDQIFIYGYFGRDIYTIQFADGSSWDRNKIEELVLLPSDGNDSIRGTASNELLYGGAGQDTIYGQGGNDTLYGEEGDDILYGGDGDDTLEGEEGDDILYGGEGNDYLSGDAGNDYLNGGNGNDSLSAGEGVDTLEGGQGNDYLTAKENSYLNGGEGDDTLRGGKNTTYRFGSNWGMDTIYLRREKGNTDVIEFDKGISVEDLIFTQNRDYGLVIQYKKGNDVIYIEGITEENHSTLAIKFADGKVLDWVAIKSFVLQGGTGNDTILGFYENDIITGGLGNDRLNGRGGNDTLYGGEGNDTLEGEGSDILYGGVGDDSLLASGGNSTLIGGEGNDYLESTYDNTSFIFDRGWGNDTILERDYALDSTDTIFFGEGIKPEDILLTESYADSNLLISLKGSTDTILVKSFFRNSSIEQAGIGAIYFADGTQWDFDYIKSHIGLKIDNWYGSGKELKGNDGNDTITGGKYDDTLIGGGGNDLLTGGAGNDTYFFDKNWGQDTIKNNSWDDSYIYGTNTQAIDVIKFGEGILSQDIMVSQGEDGVTLTIKGSNDTLYIPGLDLYNDALHYNIDQIQFADGTVWDREKLKQQAMLGTEGDDIIYGTDQNDTITAGKGNDSLNSSIGSDTYQFGLSSGQDTLSQWYMNDNEPLAGSDTIKLIDGITSEDITLTYQGQDLIIKFNQSPNDQITVQNYFTSYNKVNGILFSDGTFWGQQDITNHLPNGSLVTPNEWGDMMGGIGNDTLISGEGYNSLDGGDGSDTYIFNQNWGNDFITQFSNTKGLSATDSDTIYFGEGISEQDITIERDAYGLTLYDKNNPENKIYVNGYFDKGLNQINQIQFADGTIWSKELIDQKVNQGLQIIGTEGDDEYLMGGFGSDTIMGNAGNDYLQGENYYELFAEGIRKDYLDGGIGNDTLIAIGDQNTLLGGLGDDQLNSSGSFNTLEGNEGDDYIDSKGSYNTIDAGGGNNTIYSQGSHNKIMGGNDTDNINISAEYDYNGNPQGGYDTILGLGGDDFIGIDTDMNYIDGGDGNDYIRSNGNHNTLIGGLGDDLLEGEYSTTYQFGLNWGNDTIDNNNLNIEDIYHIAFTKGINKESLVYTKEDQNLIISDGTNSITVDAYFDEESSVCEILFADGSVLSKKEVQELIANPINKVPSTSGNDTLEGNNSYIDGGEGNDVIKGSGTIIGGNGNDTFYGIGDTDSQINGGKGDDVIYLDEVASSQNNTFYFNLGDGHDMIYGKRPRNTEGSNGVKVTDTYIFGEGIALEDITFAEWGDVGGAVSKLNIYYGNQEDQISIYLNDLYWNPNREIIFQFADGSTWKPYYLDKNGSIQSPWMEKIAPEIYGTAGNDVLIAESQDYKKIYGFTGDDQIASYTPTFNYLDGGEGNDTIFGYGEITGGKGDDTIYLLAPELVNMSMELTQGAIINFNLGDGKDTVSYLPNSALGNGAGLPDNKIVLGKGVTQDMISYSKNGNDLVLSIGNQGDNITISDYYRGESYHSITELKFNDGSILNLESLIQRKSLSVATQMLSDDMGYAAVHSFISAMASFEPPAMGQIALTENNHNTLESVIAVNSN